MIIYESKWERPWIGFRLVGSDGCPGARGGERDVREREREGIIHNDKYTSSKLRRSIESVPQPHLGRMQNSAAIGMWSEGK